MFTEVSEPIWIAPANNLLLKLVGNVKAIRVVFNPHISIAMCALILVVSLT